MEHVALFLNLTESNENAYHFLESLDPKQTQLSLLSLSESLPPYADFPSHDRKLRWEEVLQSASERVLEDFAKRVEPLGFARVSTVVLKGHFPEALVEWTDQSQTDLVVKEPLHLFKGQRQISKGDLRFIHNIGRTALLASMPLAHKHDVLVGVAPREGDEQHNKVCIELIQVAGDWAKRLQCRLHVVHAWRLHGEMLLRNRVNAEEMEEMLQDRRQQAEAITKKVLKAANLKDVAVEVEVVKGDPTRVLSGMIDIMAPSLVVLGSVGRSGVDGYLLGNTAETIAKAKGISTLIVR